MPKFPKEFDLMTRKKLIKIYARDYRKSLKKTKSRILTEFVRLTGYNRSYASWLLRNAGKKIQISTPKGPKVVIVADPNLKIKRKRLKVYDQEVKKSPG